MRSATWLPIRPAPDPSKPAHEQLDLSRSAANHTVNLASHDPVAASKWVDSLPTGIHPDVGSEKPCCLLESV